MEGDSSVPCTLMKSVNGNRTARSLLTLGNWWMKGKKNTQVFCVLCILFPYTHNRFAQNIILKKQTKKLEKHEPIQISIKSPCLHPVFGPPFNPKPCWGNKYPLTSSVRVCWFGGWQCSSVDKCDVLSQGFKFFFPFWLCICRKIKKYTAFLYAWCYADG